MKTLHLGMIAILLLIFTTLANSYSAQAYPFISFQDRYIMSDVVLIGKIISAKELSSTQTLYDVQVEQYLKNPQSGDKITIIAEGAKNTVVESPRAPPPTVYIVGERVFFYLKEQSGNYTPYWVSYPVDSLCDPTPTKSDIQRLNQLISTSDQQRLHVLHDNKEGPFRLGENLIMSYNAWNEHFTTRAFEVVFNVTRVNDSSLIFHISQTVHLKPCLGFETVTTNFVPKELGDYNVVVSFDNSSSGQLIQVRNNFSSVSIEKSIYPLSPLKQVKSGISAQNVQCKEELQLILKAEDGSPACVKPDIAIVLVEHRWATNVPQPNPMIGLNNHTGIATLGNHAYYFETPNYTETAYVHPTQISFHDVTFTLFPSGFRGGLPAWGCGGSYYWTDAKFSDGTSELLQIFVGDQQCFLPQPSTHFSNHANPQAGLTFYDGKMKLLVSVENQTKTNPNLDEFDGVIIDQSLNTSHMYSFFTNDTSVKFNTGSEGIRLEGIDKISGLDGKHVKIFGEIPVHQEGEDKIKVEKFQILGSFVPKGTQSRNMIQKVSFDDLFNNPNRYYNQTITISGQLREYDNPLGIAGVGCYSAEFTTNDEFVPDFISRHQLYSGDRYIGIRIGGQDDVGYSESEKLPLDLKNKQVTITGIFVPSIKDTGYCMHILHKSGYVLTDFEKINVVKS